MNPKDKKGVWWCARTKDVGKERARRAGRLGWTIPCLLIYCALWVSPARGQIQIVAKSSGKCLDVTGISTKAGAALQQWTCWGGDNQQWVFTEQGNGEYEIASLNSGMALAVAGNSDALGAAIVQEPYTATANENWLVQPVGGGYYRLVATSSGMCLDVTGGTGATGNGVPIQQWTCWGGNNQSWQIIAKHSVSLSWEASASSGVSGYYVYRATQASGPYTKLSSLLTETSYVDGTVQGGQTYYYVTTAANAAGQESSYSNQAEASIPVF